MKFAFLFSIGFWAVVLSMFLLAGCSASVEFGWHGKTGREDTKVTETFRKGGAANGRY